MSLPDYQSLMLPLLEVLQDGKAHSLSMLYDEVASKVGVSEEQRREMLPSGRQPTFNNRVAWAKTYMKNAGLIEAPQRGQCRITERGLGVLKEQPGRIDVAFLMRFPEFVEFRERSKNNVKEEAEPNIAGTPEEVLEDSYRKLRDDLASDLLQRMKTSSPLFFEKLVIDLLVKMGYGGSRKDAGQAIGRSGDGGIDGVIKQDRLGLDAIYVQAKRWEGTVGRPIVQSFAGSLDGVRARKGVLITTGSISAEAREYVEKIDKKIVLIDGSELTDLMIDYDLGVSQVGSFEIKEIDEDYFFEE